MQTNFVAVKTSTITQCSFPITILSSNRKQYLPSPNLINEPASEFQIKTLLWSRQQTLKMMFGGRYNNVVQCHLHQRLCVRNKSCFWA